MAPPDAARFFFGPADDVRCIPSGCIRTPDQSMANAA
jgi:hypothetical protein